MEIHRGYVERFSLNQRLQHILTMVSMVLLSLTGLALKYHDTWFGRGMIALEGGFDARGLIHRVAAIVLVALAVYHFLYLLLSEQGHRDFRKMIPSRSDLARVGWMLRTTFSARGGGCPPAGKFNVCQKVQYFGVMLGTAIMTVTGALLWFETQAMMVLPKWMIDVTMVVHGAEGLLIFVVLFLWHLYNVHLNPGAFPMSRTWLTGRMSVDELKEHHPLEYESVSKADKEGGGA
jgi:formate dehydrogenase gamma subunit